ncbi:MAG: TetR/AcrR family transcriptional regulator [Chloroflexota bacterium]|nr:TetR/AcrR family transcriptional regulator [Chloroflexota bacterium]
MPRVRDDSIYEEMQVKIKSFARQQMAEGGTASISLRGIATALQVTAPALYRYYPTRDDLLTALIVDAFNALADALEAAEAAHAAAKAPAQLMAVLHAYRQWALEHPTDFQLIYGNPIPGYDAPSDVTVPAVVRTFIPLVRPLSLASENGLFTPQPPFTDIPPHIAAHEQALVERGSYPIDVKTFHIAMILWAQLHGVIMLELFHHIAPNVGDVDAFYDSSLRAMLTVMGMKW